MEFYKCGTCENDLVMFCMYAAIAISCLFQREKKTVWHNNLLPVSFLHSDPEQTIKEHYICLHLYHLPSIYVYNTLLRPYQNRPFRSFSFYFNRSHLTISHFCCPIPIQYVCYVQVFTHFSLFKPKWPSNFC